MCGYACVCVWKCTCFQCLFLLLYMCTFSTFISTYMQVHLVFPDVFQSLFPCFCLHVGVSVSSGLPQSILVSLYMHRSVLVPSCSPIPLCMCICMQVYLCPIIFHYPCWCVDLYVCMHRCFSMSPGVPRYLFTCGHACLLVCKYVCVPWCTQLFVHVCICVGDMHLNVSVSTCAGTTCRRWFWKTTPEVKTLSRGWFCKTIP